MKGYLLRLFQLAALALFACGPQTRSEKSDAPPLTLEIERNHELMDILFPEGTEVEILGQGFEWTEGPLWVEKEQMLLFSEIPTNTVHRWRQGEGVRPYLQPSGYTGTADRGGEVGSNGLLLNPEGRLVLCQHGDRQMALMDAPLANPKPIYQSIADNYEGKRFNSPNDAVFDSQGNLYFTDPPYGLEKNINDPLKELPFQGVYRYSPVDETITLLVDSLSRPNGIHFLPGEHSLLIANSDPQKPYWYVYRVLDQGKSLDEGQIFYDASVALQQDKGLPDGLKVSAKGIIYATGPGGVWIFDAQGMLLGKLKVGQLTSNVALDNAERYLYVTADSYVIRVPIQQIAK
ncbi:MAG: SMP-30/gluconolactonase/LRE family protein [Lunatimonas sp.]|uniref:SMP-30/gluconolactonase/LRE family protein n=1 Tax=Lunatimonas sp. TaxID=2060141 RepID=UPI00263AEFF4|nr:SMP-30/gluconolactonase/LRE family protein [Lunatimonas sp.]MCC5939467.1 SMP-30/gluconolactonase/LRE family protein [Lunatimonas sp.]